MLCRLVRASSGEASTGLASLGISGHAYSNALIAVDVTGAETAAVTDEIAIHLVIKPVHYPAQSAVTFTGIGVTTYAAACTNRRRSLQVPFTHVVLAERFIRENTGWTNFRQIAAELTFKRTFLPATEISVVMGSLRTKISATGVILVIAYAAIAGNTAVHLVPDEWAKVLVGVSFLLAVITPVVMTRHNSHILQMTFTTLFADRTVVRVIDHDAFNCLGAELGRFFDGITSTIAG